MMAIHVGDYGTVVNMTVTEDGAEVDISTATAKKFIFKNRSGRVEVDADFVTDGSDGELTYTFLEGDLDTAGTWQVQAKVTLATGEWFTEAQTFQVVQAL